MKKMKCPVCHGTTKRKTIFGDYTECGWCNGTGEIQTREEYIQHCSSEELVEEILNIALNANYLHKRIAAIPRDEDGAVLTKDVYKIIAEWLKERSEKGAHPHDGVL